MKNMVARISGIIVLLLAVLGCELSEEDWRVGYCRRQFNEGSYGNAISVCSEGLKKFPDNAELYMVRGAAYSALKKNDLSIFDLNRSIDLSPNNYAAYHRRAIVYARMGHIPKAINDFEKVLKLNPKSTRTYELYAYLLSSYPNEEYRDGNCNAISIQW